MSDVVPIYLPTDGGLIARVDGHSARVEPAGLPAGVPFMLVVPGEDVTMVDADVPPVRQAGRRHQAARYALEDQLAAPIDNLHLALGTRRRDGTHPAAIVDHDCMQGWLDTLGDARGRVTAGMMPDYLCLPVPPDDGAELWLIGNRALLRRDATRGLACEQDLLPHLLTTEDGAATVNVRVQADTDADAVLERLRQQGFDVQVQDRPDPDRMLDELLAGAGTQTGIDLLQMGYAPHSALHAWWRPLRATAILAAVWLGLATLAQGVHYYQLQQRYDELQTRTENNFRNAFPQVQTINNMRVQAEAEVRQLRAARGTDGLFPLLDATATATGSVPGLRMQSLQYRNGELFLDLQGRSVRSVEKLRDGFADDKRANLTVQNAEASDDGVNIRARIAPENS